MKLLIFCGLSLFVLSSAAAGRASSPTAALRTAAFNLPEASEVGLEIEARAPGASWERKGAEAAALTVFVDGRYHQDLLLWAGEEFYQYRVALGRLSRGRHEVSVRLNEARSAAGARRAEVRALRPLTSPAGTAEDQFARKYSPFLYARANSIDRFTDIPLLMYYEIERGAGDELLIRYTTIFTNEDGGTQTARLMARWGRATDIEWTYELRLRGGKISEETYQGVEHETKRFTGERAAGAHPLLATASDNNNFSDLACSAVRYAPLPVRADLSAASREIVMDEHPETYRAMALELAREKRLSDGPSGGNIIADPRRYLYLEGYAEQPGGTTVSFEINLPGGDAPLHSDFGDPGARIERGGYFRSAVRTPTPDLSGAGVALRCHTNGKGSAAARACQKARLTRAFTLDEHYRPRPLRIETVHEAPALAPGEAATYRLK